MYTEVTKVLDQGPEDIPALSEVKNDKTPDDNERVTKAIKIEGNNSL